MGIAKPFCCKLTISLIVVFLSIFSSAAEENTNPKLTSVLVFSATTQGNGYNWAATLSWLSEQLMAAYREGQALKASNPDRDIVVDLASFGGGSSGSAVALVLDALKTNNGLLADKDSIVSEFFSLERVRRIAMTLRFLALGSDFHKFIVGSTAFRLGAERLKYDLDLISEIISFVPDFIGRGRPNQWKHQMDTTVVVSDFGRMIFFAQNVSWAEIDQSISQFQGYDKWRKIAKKNPEFGKLFFQIQSIYELIQPEMGRTYSAKTLEQLNQFTAWQAKSIKGQVKHSIRARVSRFIDDTRRFNNAMTPEPSDSSKIEKNKFAKSLALPMGSGIMTIALAAPFKDYAEIQSHFKNGGKVDYTELKAYILCSEETAERILNSEYYQNAIRARDPFISRYRIAVVDQRWAAMNMSVREPELLNELVENLDSSDVRIKKIYDPDADIKKEFRLVDSDLAEKRGVFVIGGFPLPEVTGRIQTYFHRARVDELIERGFATLPRYHMFSKPAAKGLAATFAGKQLAGVLNQRGELGAKENLEDWAKWIESFSQSEPLLLETENTLLVKTLMDWDISKTPSALAGLNRVLVPMAVNEARLAYESAISATPVCQKVFVPKKKG